MWLLGLFLLPLLARAEQFIGKVVGIRTGDTLSVLRNGRVVQVHLYGIACPERWQAFSTQARQFTRDLTLRRTVAVVVDAVATDAAKRRAQLIAAVQLPNGLDLSQVLVQAGYAWHDTRYAPHDKRLAQLQAEARADATWAVGGYEPDPALGVGPGTTAAGEPCRAPRHRLFPGSDYWQPTWQGLLLARLS